MCVYCNLLTAMNLVGSTWTIWSPLISTHGITMHHFTDRHPETLDMASASDSLRRSRDLQKVVVKLPRRLFFRAFIREYSWCTAMSFVCFCLFLSISSVVLPNVYFVSNCETTSGHFLFSFASLLFPLLLWTIAGKLSVGLASHVMLLTMQTVDAGPR